MRKYSNENKIQISRNRFEYQKKGRDPRGWPDGIKEKEPASSQVHTWKHNQAKQIDG